jgi:hypothetical protein
LRALERESDLKGVAQILEKELDEEKLIKNKDMTTKEKNARVWIE